MIPSFYVTFCLYPIVLYCNHPALLIMSSAILMCAGINSSVYFFTHPDRMETLIWMLANMVLFGISFIKCMEACVIREEEPTIHIHVD